MKKLTEQEIDNMYAFIGKAVLNNTTFSLKIGVNANIHQLCNDFNVTSLQSYGQFLYKKIKEVSLDDFNRSGLVKEEKIGCFSLKEVYDFVVTLFHFKLNIEESENLVKKLADIENDLDKFKSPEEKRKELEQQREQLLSIFGKENKVTETPTSVV